MSSKVPRRNLLNLNYEIKLITIQKTNVLQKHKIINAYQIFNHTQFNILIFTANLKTKTILAEMIPVDCTLICLLGNLPKA